MSEGGKLVRGTPLVTQLTDELRTAIQTGEYGPGDMLPSETALMKRFGVSRNTVRPALAALRLEGLINVVNGRGSFVAKERDRLTLERTGADPWADVKFSDDTHAERDYACAAMADLLKVELNDLLFVVHLKGERSGGRTVMARRIVPSLPLEEINPEPDPYAPLSDLLDVLTAAYGPLRQAELVRGFIPSPDEASALDITPGSPAFEVVRLTLSRDGRPLVAEIERTAMDGTAYYYRMPAPKR